MNHKAKTIVIVLFFLFVLHIIYGTPVDFAFAFLYKTGKGEIKAVDYSEAGMVLQQEDQLKIYLKPGKGLFLYLFLYDAEGRLYLLYPLDFADFSSSPYGEGVYIPRELEWFPLEGSGEERFYLVASINRLKQLEESMEYYSRVSNSDKTERKRLAEAKQNVLENIRELQVKNFDLVKKAKENIVFVAGEFRGFEEEFPAEVINVAGFYSRVIRIIH